MLINYFLCLSVCWHSGSVGIHIPKMLQLFKTGHEYMVESECYVRTQIATVRLSKVILFSIITVFFFQCYYLSTDM